MGHSLALMMIPHRPFGTPASGPVHGEQKKKRTSNRGRGSGVQKTTTCMGMPDGWRVRRSVLESQSC